jgi:hypothetical protein
MMRGRYVTERVLANVERRLSGRDRAIVDTLDSLRVATTRQLRTLHFTDLTQASSARQAPKALARLARLGLLTSLPRQVGGTRAGSASTIWALDRSGQRLASAAGPAGGIRPRRPWVPSLPFVAHRLAVSQLFVDLTVATRAGGGELLGFEAEPLSWRRYAAPHGGWSYVKPDATVRLAVGEYERGYFIEVDRATEARLTIVRKCTAYRRYWETGRAQDRYGYFPQVAFVVPTDARKELVVDVLAQQPEEAWPLFRVVLADEAPVALIGGTR